MSVKQLSIESDISAGLLLSGTLAMCALRGKVTLNNRSLLQNLAQLFTAHCLGECRAGLRISEETKEIPTAKRNAQV